MFRCVAAIPNAGGNCIQLFYEDTEEGRAKAEAFAREHDKPGMGVYDCVSLLKEERRTKETVAEIPGLHWDIDARQVNETKEQIVERVRAKLEPFGLLSRLVDSGRGVHVYSTLREPIAAGAPEMEAAEQILARMIEHLGADPALKHFAALMRRPGTTNSKEGGGPCQVILDAGARCELSDIATYLDLVENNGPLFVTRKEPDKTNNETQEDLPADPEARLAIMRFENKTGRGINATLKFVIPALIWKATHPEDVHKKVMQALRATAGRDNLQWDWKKEERQTNERILSAYHNLFEVEHSPASGIPVWVPMEFHQTWSAILAEGRCPTMQRNGAGFHVRRKREAGEKSDDLTDEKINGAEDIGSEAASEHDDAPKAPFILRPIKKFDAALIPPREFLFGRHYQRRTVSGTVAPGGTGKSSLVMVEAIAMATGRDLLGEGAKDPLRVWYHNGEDNMLELQRRVGAICQHYNIPMEELETNFFMTSGNEMPLRVAETWSQVRLQTDHRLVKCITEAIGDNKIDAGMFDPLVTLHLVPENNSGQMDQVIRIFTRMADSQNCAIDLSHHTRKLAPGSAEDYGIDDMRGAGAVKDAMRAVRMLNVMSPKDAENAGVDELERANYFRIDRAKANYSGPAKTAIWRQFVNVDLPNEDGVGVVMPWLFPGQDGKPSPEKAEAERKAEHVFLEVLRRLFLAGRFVGEKGTYNAPHVIAKEREAKIAKVGKTALDAAMRRLFDKGKIRIEEYLMANRHPGTRIVEV